LRKLLPDARNKKGQIETEVNLVKIGDLWLATVPGELLPKLGLRIKAQLRESGAGVRESSGWQMTSWVTYCLSRIQVSVESFKPGKHYEETNSIGKGIAPAVISALGELLQGEKHV